MPRAGAEGRPSVLHQTVQTPAGGEKAPQGNSHQEINRSTGGDSWLIAVREIEP